MPDIIGQISTSNNDDFEKILNSFYNSNYAKVREIYDNHISISNISLEESVIPELSDDEHIIIFHGYLKDCKLSKIEITSYIKNQFNKYGVKFVNKLRGSFQILI